MSNASIEEKLNKIVGVLADVIHRLGVVQHAVAPGPDIHQSGNTPSPNQASGQKSKNGPVTPSISPNTKPSSRDKRNSKGGTHYKPDQTPLWKMILEIGAVLVALVAICMYGLQWQAMRDQLDLTKQQMINSERPWVFPNIDSTSPFLLDEKDNKAAWVMWMKNTGSSPALKVRWRFHPEIVDNNAPSIQKFGKAIEGYELVTDQEFSIAPGEKVPNSGNFFQPLSTIRIMQKDAAHVMAIGARVVYEDQFGGEQHETTLCIVEVPSIPPFPEGWANCPVITIAK